MPDITKVDSIRHTGSRDAGVDGILCVGDDDVNNSGQPGQPVGLSCFYDTTMKWI